MNTIDFTKIAKVKLSYSLKVKASERPRITASKEIYEIFSHFWDLDTLEHIEQMKLVLLNRANRVLGIADISSGGVTGTVCDPKVIYQHALEANASSIILCHNHPSGNLTASTEDNKITTKIKEAGKFLDIALLDHLIITTEGYYSYADQGLL